MNKLIVKDNEKLSLKAIDSSVIDVLKHSNVTINLDDFNGSELFVNIEANATVKFLYFTKKTQNNQIKILVQEDVNLNLDLILMNGNTNLDLQIDIIGQGATVNVNTLSLAKEAEKNININIIHNAKYTNSNVVNYGISFAKGVNKFKTIGKIHRLMKDSDVRQITKGLLLSPTGVCLAEPILLIDYFDVKAYHGATIGKINDDDLFYLMSRGLTKDEAFMLVINGLVTPFIDKIEDEELKEIIKETYIAYFRGEANE